MKLKDKLKSDQGVMNSTEVIMLIALSVFLVLAIYDLIVKPMVKTAGGIGLEVKDMNPRP